jgi:hypothetical protein
VDVDETIGAGLPEGREDATAGPREPEAGAGLRSGPAKAGKEGFQTIKTERLPDGRTKRILKDTKSGRIVEEVD